MNKIIARIKIYTVFVWLFFGILSTILWFISGLFVVLPDQQVLVLKFGSLDRIIEQPGLYWYCRGWQSIVLYPKKILNADVQRTELTLKDQKRIIVDVFVRYRINDPKTFYEAFNNIDNYEAYEELKHDTNSETYRIRGSRKSLYSENFTHNDPEFAAVPSLRKAAYMINTTVGSELMNTLGKRHLSEVLSEKRNAIENTIKQKASMQLGGIELIEVKIKCILFPAQNEKAIIARMCTGPEREAKKLLGEAEEFSKRIRSDTDLIVAKNKGNAIAYSAKLVAESHYTNNVKLLKAYKSCPELANLILMSNGLENLNIEFFGNTDQLSAEIFKAETKKKKST